MLLSNTGTYIVEQSLLDIYLFNLSDFSHRNEGLRKMSRHVFKDVSG